MIDLFRERPVPLFNSLTNEFSSARCSPTGLRRAYVVQLFLLFRCTDVSLSSSPESGDTGTVAASRAHSLGS